jgi:hypothetical protein
MSENKKDAESSSSHEKRPQVSAQERIRQFRRKHSVSDLFDTTKPWVLVDEGSFLGFFDFVPPKYRSGPWRTITTCYLAGILYLLAVGFVWVVSTQSPNGGWIHLYKQIDPYDAYTPSWWYNSLGFLWTSYVSWNVFTASPLGASAWCSYTLQSWTYLTLRHGLCALAPFAPPIVTVAAEVLRFPVLITASVTFAIWNFVLAPIVIMVFVKDNEQRKKFFQYFTNFRLTQLHVFNILFATINGALTFPKRSIHAGDLLVAGMLVIQYMVWYYSVLDRFGIHLYPIFSPRTYLSILSWNLILVSYFGGFWWWKRFLSDE